MPLFEQIFIAAGLGLVLFAAVAVISTIVAQRKAKELAEAIGDATSAPDLAKITKRH